jgi:hypothetical protein
VSVTIPAIRGVSAPIVVTAAVVTAVHRCGYDDNGWGRPIGVIGTWNGNGYAPSGESGDHPCQNHRTDDDPAPLLHLS